MADSAVAVAIVTGGFGLAVAVVGVAGGLLSTRRRSEPDEQVGDPEVRALVRSLAEAYEELQNERAARLACEAREAARDD